MTKDEFLKAMHTLVEEFGAYWAQAQRTSEGYPEELSLIDWSEQFEAFWDWHE